MSDDQQQQTIAAAAAASDAEAREFFNELAADKAVKEKAAEAADMNEHRTRMQREAQRAHAIQMKAEKMDLERRRLAHEQQKQKLEEHKLKQKEREDMMKSMAKATKEADTARTLRLMEEQKEEDTPQARETALRKLGQMREMLGVHGTKKRIDHNTPLHVMKTELAIMNSQVNMERAIEMPREILDLALTAGEQFAAPFYPCHGLADEVSDMLERAATDDASEKERHFSRALAQISIQYSDWFELGPAMFMAMTIAEIAKTKHEEHAELRRRAENAEADAEEAAFLDEASKRF